MSCLSASADVCMGPTYRQLRNELCAGFTICERRTRLPGRIAELHVAAEMRSGRDAREALATWYGSRRGASSPRRTRSSQQASKDKTWV